MGEYPARSDYIREMIREFGVDGVILQRIRNCDLWGSETFLLRKNLEELGIPLLVLDREYMLTGMGQLSTRVQAFLEMVASRVD